MSQVSIKLTPRDNVGLPYAPSNNANTILLFQQFFKGDQGIQGIQGKSAYQIWLDDGHTGTPEDFINDIDPNLINAALDAIAARNAMVKPSIDLNFAENKYIIYDSFANSYVDAALGDILTIDNGAATGFDAVGLLSTSAEDSARLVFDPVTGKSLGLLHEASAENKVLQSEDINAGSQWSKSATYVGQETINGILLTEINDNSSSLTQSYSQSFTLTAGVAQYLSVAVKKGTSDASQIALQGAGITGAQFVVIDWATLTFSTVTSGIEDAELIYLLDDFYLLRYKVKAENVVGGTAILYLWATNFVGGGATTGTTKYGRVQLEINGFTSYIPTAASAVTRLVDKFYRTLGDEFNPREGTLVFKGVLHAVGSSGSALLCLSDGTYNNRIMLWFDATGKPAAFIANGGVATVQQSITAGYVTGHEFVAAMSFKANSCILSFNGVSVEDTSVTIPTGLNQLAPGRVASGLTTQILNGTIARARYIPKWLDADDLNAITVEGVAA